MKRRNKRVKYIVLFLTGIFTIFLLLNYTYTKVYAEEDLCPGIDDDTWECVDYLSTQSEALHQKESDLEKELEDEEYQQLSLSQKINYITSQISQSEKLIESMEVEISAKTVEIGLLEKELLEKEDNISIMKQEISILEESVNQRIEESYKYSFIGTLEIFLDGGDLDSILRRTKYLIETREKDKEALSNMNDKVGELKAEELELASKKESLEQKKVDLEDEKTDLVAEKTELDKQKSEKDRLLVESKAREAELLVELKATKERTQELDNYILAYINAHMDDLKFTKSVTKGQPIGYIYPSATRCSNGPHLHFAIDSRKNAKEFYPTVDIYASGYLNIGSASGRTPAADGWTYPYVLAGAYAVPIMGSGVYITQDYHDPNLNYIKDPGEDQYYATDLSKDGISGSTVVVAAEAGAVAWGVDPCDQTYAVVKHSNGYRTIYVHLQSME